MLDHAQDVGGPAVAYPECFARGWMPQSGQRHIEKLFGRFGKTDFFRNNNLTDVLANNGPSKPATLDHLQAVRQNGHSVFPVQRLQHFRRVLNQFRAFGQTQELAAAESIGRIRHPNVFKQKFKAAHFDKVWLDLSLLDSLP